ncbi:MAG TPA: TRC40/GET3/ArsA family transport-energizing ATPase [Bryobacteraceae bacterium]|jgi:arsenite-transporting ATPase|nr:TRC40/GET3/ArsA family transport-energizing ATPase [Bryobacteraceae bacterium]
MRILLFSGKGGVGKTSLAAATGVRLAQRGMKTLVMSVDPAHSLADSFQLDVDLFTSKTADTLPVDPNLDILEVNIQREIKRYWREVSSYLIGLLRSTGVGDVEAEELAILPGMEELSAMMYVNQFRKEGRYDAIVLDCAPTAESLRFVSMPTVLDWYMTHLFPIERKVLKAVRPIANRVSPVELPGDNYFANILELFQKISGINEVLDDPEQTSVRLVTNPEKMVLRETQRAFVYFSLHGLTVDRILVNRVLPDSVSDRFFAGWRRAQSEVLREVHEYFAPIDVRHVPLFTEEVLGRRMLDQLAQILYPDDENPAAILNRERPYTFEKHDGKYEVRLRLPFATKGEIGLFKKGDVLVVEIGTLRRHIGLPTSMASLVPARARLENKLLTVELREGA